MKQLKTLTIKVPERLLEALQGRAERQRRTTSDLARFLLERAMGLLPSDPHEAVVQSGKTWGVAFCANNPHLASDLDQRGHLFFEDPKGRKVKESIVGQVQGLAENHFLPFYEAWQLFMSGFFGAIHQAVHGQGRMRKFAVEHGGTKVEMSVVTRREDDGSYTASVVEGRLEVANAWGETEEDATDGAILKVLGFEAVRRAGETLVRHPKFKKKLIGS